MGGGLWLERDDEPGNHLRARIPMGQRRQPLPNEEQEALDSVRRTRVLVADSSTSSRRAAGSYAAEWEVEVVEATNVEQAVTILEAAERAGELIDVVVTDLDLPGGGGRELAQRIRATQSIRPTRLVLQKPLGRIEKPGSLARAGFDAWVTKPASGQRLLSALHHVVSIEADPASQAREPHAEVKHLASDESSGHARLQVLLAEDNLVNQKVAGLLLRTLGCEVFVVSNGRDAVHAVRDNAFDLVFLDCQMPILSGFDAARGIRSLEGERQRGVPIIAMTASAMPSDKRRCLDAGMDDHLSKPVQKEDLDRMIARWAKLESGQSPTPEPNPVMNGEPNEAVLDRDVIESLKELGGEDDPGLFVELVQLFLDDTPTRMAELHAAVESSDAEQLERAAHALKSSAANLGAMLLSDTFRQIEMAGRDGNVGGAVQLVDSSNDQFEAVKSALQAEIA